MPTRSTKDARPDSSLRFRIQCFSVNDTWDFARQSPSICPFFLQEQDRVEPSLSPINMSHMAQLNAPLPPAFRLVRRILAERPRQFQDLLREALALHTTESGDVAASSSTPTTVPAPPRRASGKGKKAENLAIKFPEGHPFVSAK